MRRSFLVSKQPIVAHVPTLSLGSQTSVTLTKSSLPRQERAQLSHDKATLAQLWQDALLPYLGTRLLILVVGLLATYYVLPLIISNPRLPAYSTYGAWPQSLWLMWQRFDSGFYLDIAQHGYAPIVLPHAKTDWVFYPLYPLLISGLGKLFGGTSSSFPLAGLLIANLAGIFMIAYFYLLVRQEFNRKVAARAVIYLALFPLAFFLSAIYTESLLLGLSIACIYYARQRSWWLASLCGGLATLTRLQGITLIIPLAWEYLRVVSARYVPPPTELPPYFLARFQLQARAYFSGLWLAVRDLKNWLTALALSLIPAGLLAFMLYGKIYAGDFFATFHASKWEWGRHISPPWRLLVYSLRNPIWGQPLNWNFWTLNIAMTLAFLAVMLWAFRRLPMIYALYTATTVLLPLASSSLNSIARYDLLVFPVFILLALLTIKSEKQPLHNFILAAFAALQAVLLVFFVIGLFAIA
jgi:dolichyl-phosphate-mannose-protein mannosyltransferase